MGQLGGICPEGSVGKNRIRPCILLKFHTKSPSENFVLSTSLQLDFERSQVRRLEKEQRRITDQLEEERAQHKQLSCALAKECKWASARALEEGHRLTELSRKLDKVCQPILGL